MAFFSLLMAIIIIVMSLVVQSISTQKIADWSRTFLFFNVQCPMVWKVSVRHRQRVYRKKSFQMLWSTSYYLTRLYNNTFTYIANGQFFRLVSEEISISKFKMLVFLNSRSEKSSTIQKSINWIRQLSIIFYELNYHCIHCKRC